MARNDDDDRRDEEGAEGRDSDGRGGGADEGSAEGAREGSREGSREGASRRGERSPESASDPEGGRRTDRRSDRRSAGLDANRRGLRRIAALLDEAKLKFTLDAEHDYIRVGFKSDHYVDEDGDNSISMFLTVREEGELLLIEIPLAYRMTEARSRRAARKALLYANFAIKSIQFSVDPGDGDEVRARLELWQVGIEPTADYLHSHLDRLARQFDYCDRLIRPVWKYGRSALRQLVARNMRPEESGKASGSGSDRRGGKALRKAKERSNGRSDRGAGRGDADGDVS